MAGEQDDVTVNIGGNAEGARQAAQEAADAFTRLRGEASTTGDSFTALNAVWAESARSAADFRAGLTAVSESVSNFRDMQSASVASLREATASMSEQRQEMQYLADATRILGGEQADVRMSWLLAADSADEYSARLGFLREQLAMVRQEQMMLADDMGLGAGGGGLGGRAGGFGGIGGLLGGLSEIPLLGNAASMFTGMLGMQLFNGAYQGISDFFTQGLFGLNKQTEQNVYSWQYTYGMGMSPTQAMANAQNISAWSQRYSMDIPFTRQSLMTAISGAAPLGLDLQGLQHYFPIFSDLAATHINPFTGQPVDLGTVVQAVRGAEMGYSRMLKYDLNITPEDLVKYGLAGQGSGMGFKITDMSTLLPALERYSEANGWTKFNAQGQDRGAAYNTAHSTFWGEWSSFLDRIQNTELTAGGGLFGGLKDSLEGISNWMDQHPDQLKHLADVIGGDVTGAFKTASSAVEGLGAGLHASGFDKQLMEGLQGLENWFADPKHQQEVKEVAGAVGNALGNLGHGIGTAAGDFTQVWDSLAHSGFGQDMAKFGVPGLQQFYSHYFGAFGDLTQSGTNFFTDLLNGDYNDALTAATNSLQNLASVTTFGLIPAIQEGTTVAEQGPGSLQQPGKGKHPAGYVPPPSPNTPHSSATGAIVPGGGSPAAVAGGAQAGAVSVNDYSWGGFVAIPQGVQSAVSTIIGNLQQSLPSADTGSKQGSDYMSGLSMGMQRTLPQLSATAHQSGTVFAQQLLLGIEAQLGGSGGLSGIGPGSSIADIIKASVAQAMRDSAHSNWTDAHAPGSLNRFGQYGAY